ncbi:hypothetical protein EVAR_50764_1 [Eumeta japonica]|uniref:Uncharacterized protein n=1 Tax=Eumeta variegata TaxID=151549 RepID=A0A4C1Y6D8_EUMVA|nr:hypothetical protein EVAR_50764_1 [Eumeta japonica]
MFTASYSPVTYKVQSPTYKLSYRGRSGRDGASNADGPRRNIAICTRHACSYTCLKTGSLQNCIRYTSPGRQRYCRPNLGIGLELRVLLPGTFCAVGTSVIHFLFIVSIVLARATYAAEGGARGAFWPRAPKQNSGGAGDSARPRREKKPRIVHSGSFILRVLSLHRKRCGIFDKEAKLGRRAARAGSLHECKFKKARALHAVLVLDQMRCLPLEDDVYTLWGRLWGKPMGFEFFEIGIGTKTQTCLTPIENGNVGSVYAVDCDTILKVVVQEF